MRVRRIIICGQSESAMLFSTLSHKRHDFRKEVVEYKMYYDLLCYACLEQMSLKEELADMP